MNAGYMHVRVIEGGAVHLAHPDGYPVCGAGHRYRSTGPGSRRPKAIPTDDPVTCRRCQSFSHKRPELEALYAVRATYADNPAQDTIEHLTAQEIITRWPWMAALFDPSERVMVRLSVTFEDLSQVRIDEDTPCPGDLGYNAGYMGVAIEENPFAPQTPEHEEWNRGHATGVSDRRRLHSIGLD